MKGIGAKHQETLSVPLLRGMTCWSELSSSPYAGRLEGVITALPCYTFQKEKKTPIFGVEKGKARIGHPGPIDFYKKTKL